MPKLRECPSCGGKVTSGSRTGYCVNCVKAAKLAVGEALKVNGGHANAGDLAAYLVNGAPVDPYTLPPLVTAPAPAPPATWGLRHLALDIETSGGFNTSYGRILCCCLLLEGEKEVRVLDGFRYADERTLLQQLHELWPTFDILVTFNGKRFDARFIAGRMIQHGLPTLPRKLHLDLLPYCRKWRLASARLGSVTEALQLDDQKGHVPAEFWNRAVGGDREAYDTIVTYCKQDVRCLPALIERIRPMVTGLTLGSF